MNPKKRYFLTLLMAAMLTILAAARATAQTTFFADSFDRANDFNIDSSTNGMSGILVGAGALGVDTTWIEPVDVGNVNDTNAMIDFQGLKMGGQGNSVHVFVNRNFATIFSNGVISVSLDLVTAPGGAAPLPHRYAGIGVAFALSEASSSLDRRLSRFADLFVAETANGLIRINDDNPALRTTTGDVVPNFTNDLNATTAVFIPGTLRLDMTFTNTIAGSRVNYNLLFAGTNVLSRSFVLSDNNEIYIGVEERSTPAVTNDNFTISASSYTPPAVNALTWKASANNAWDTSTTNWVDSGLGINSYAFFNGAGATFSDATANTSVNVPGAVLPSSVFVNNAVSNYNFSGAGSIGGTGNLTKAGAGLLTIGTANSFSGGATISAGRLRVANNNALGNGLLTLAGGAISSDGATARTVTNAVKVTGNVTLGDLADNGTLTFNQTVDFSGALRNVTLNNDCVFNAGVTNGAVGSKLGSGTTLTIRGLVEYSGAADVQDGILIYDGATVHDSDRVIADTFTVNGIARLIITNGASVAVSNTVSNLRSGRQASTGSNYVDLAGTYLLPNADANNGRVTLQSTAAYSEMTFWQGGDFTARGVASIGGGSGTTVFKFNGGILRARNDNATFFEGLTQTFVQSGGARIDDGGFAIVINQALLDGGGGGGLTKTGAGTLTLNGANTYTGSTVVSNGTLALNTGSLSGGGAIVVANNASLSVSNSGGTLTVPSLTLGGGATNTLKFNFPSGNPGVASVSAASLTANNYCKIDVAGSGFTAGLYPLVNFTTCAGLNNFHLGSVAPGVSATLVTNATSISLNVSSVVKSLLWTGAANNQWDTSSIDWADVNNGNASTNYAQSGGFGDVVTFDGTMPTNINLTTTLTPVAITVANGSGADYAFTGAGKLSGVGSLTKLGFGSLTLSTANDYSGGTLINGGNILIGANQALGTGPATLNVDGKLASDSTTPRSLSNSIVLGADTGAFFGDVVNTGTLTLAGGLNLGGSGTRTLNFNSDIIVSGPITNGGFSLKTGSGNLIIRGNSSIGSQVVAQQNGDITVDGATLTSADGWRVQSTLGSKALRLVVTNGGVLNVSQTTLTGNLRVGFTGGDDTATNVVDISGTVNLTPTGTVGANSAVGMGQSGAYDVMYLRSGGLLITRALFGQPNAATNSISEVHFNGGTIKPLIDETGFITGLTNAFIENGGLTIDTTNLTVTVDQPLLAAGAGGLNKTGSGTLNLTGTSTYVGGTIVSNGTLNVNGAVAGAATVRSGATLAGTGSVGGVVTVQAGGTLAAGAGTIGSLGIGGSPVLNGSVAAEINRNGGSPLADIITVAGPVTYGGTLVVSNVGASLLAGDAFTLFTASGHTGSFSSIAGSPGAGLAYSFTNGVLSVVTASSVANNPTNITSSVSGTTLNLSWPADHLGWFLQTQTNSRALGLKAADANWFDVTGSDSSTNATITIDRANPTVFYRLRHP